MIAVQIVALLVVALGALGDGGRRATRSARRSSSASTASRLGILFFAFQAPDVALSNIVIGAVAMPTMILLAIAKTRN